MFDENRWADEYLSYVDYIFWFRRQNFAQAWPTMSPGVTGAGRSVVTRDR